jgi:3' terminal RNA ribose 2'-O-methyltransferase Hen1
MLLTVETTHTPATDLGYLLRKNPATVHTAEHPYGVAHVFYPVATEERCQIAIVVEVDPLALVRGGSRAHRQWALGQYVNDRPYAASSLLCTVINKELHSALKGRSTERPELATTPIPLIARLSAVVSDGGEQLLRDLFTPLSYEVSVEAHPLDAQFPQWGADTVFTLTLAATKTLCELLTHLYVLIPVLDNDKHYWVSEDEIKKLLDYGSGWLERHPQRELITRRYLKHQGVLAREALAQLAEAGEDPDAAEERQEQEEHALERPLNLQSQRIELVAQAIKASGAQRVLDLGCGEGALIAELLTDRQYSEITGVDVSIAALNRAAKRLHLDHMPALQRERIRLLQGALTYRDNRLQGYDAAALVEVIEHLDPSRLQALEGSVFGFAQPRTVIVTTPNAEYNACWPSLPAGRFRHRDHRFEWTRSEFSGWAQSVADQHGYSVSFTPIGAEKAGAGAPTQMAVFRR